jgi:hypothetical protein
MNLRAAVAVVFALTGCATTTNNERTASPPVITADRVFLQSRSLGLMPRAQSTVAANRSASLIVSDHDRKIGR